MHKASPSDQEYFWWNSRTKQVEHGPKSPALDRVGPFDTREQAEQAEQLLEERARAWREEDEEKER